MIPLKYDIIKILQDLTATEEDIMKELVSKSNFEIWKDGLKEYFFVPKNLIIFDITFSVVFIISTIGIHPIFLLGIFLYVMARFVLYTYDLKNIKIREEWEVKQGEFKRELDRLYERRMIR